MVKVLRSERVLGRERLALIWFWVVGAPHRDRAELLEAEELGADGVAGELAGERGVRLARGGDAGGKLGLEAQEKFVAGHGAQKAEPAAGR